MLEKKGFSGEFKDAFEKKSGMRIEYVQKKVLEIMGPLFLGAVVGFVVVFVLSYLLKGIDNLVGWVQAVGSIIAIFFAIYVGDKQNENNMNIFYKGKKIDQELENENILMEIYSVGMLVERMGKTTSSFLLNIGNKTDFIFLKEKEENHKYDHNRIKNFDMELKFIVGGKVNIGKFFDDLVETHSNHKKRIQFLIRSASIIDGTKYPALFTSHDLCLSYMECQNFIDLVDEFIKYSESIKEETDAHIVMPKVSCFLNDILGMHRKISENQLSIFDIYDGMSDRLEKSINGPYWNKSK